MVLQMFTYFSLKFQNFIENLFDDEYEVNITFTDAEYGYDSSDEEDNYNSDSGYESNFNNDD